MDYKEMTKAELIKIINKQKHLAEAVEAKDKEIAQHLKDISELAQQSEKVKALEEEKKYLQSHIKAMEEQDIKVGGEQRIIETVLLSLTGDIDLRNVSKLTSQLNVPGGDQLKKASKQ